MKKIIIFLAFYTFCHLATAVEPLKMQTRARVPFKDGEVVKGSFTDFAGFDGFDYRLAYETVEWNPAQTAVIVCDMWNMHHCKDAAGRVNELVPRMNAVLVAARQQGVMIVHSPSDCMAAYAEHPARKAAVTFKKTGVETGIAVPAVRWKHRGENEPDLPIDDSDGGCDLRCRFEPAPKPWWTAQHPGLEIADCDLISDSDEIYYAFRQKGIKNVIIMGVHTNMCVLGRPFGIRNLVGAGYNVVLMRDMTDSMYNPQKRPQVPHVRGTELVVGHIERHWCPTVVSCDFVHGPAFRFREDTRPHIVLLVSDDHYMADITLPLFGEYLMDRWGLYCSVIHGEGTAKYRHFDNLDTADTVVMSQRRIALPEPLMAKFLKHLEKPRKGYIGIRTASHGFAARKVPQGHVALSEAEMEKIHGGGYHDHGPNAPGCDVTVPEAARELAVMRDVSHEPWHTAGSQYYTLPLAEDSVVLQECKCGDRVEPLTWIRRPGTGKPRVAYTALGFPSDFNSPAGRAMLRSLIFWSLDVKMP